jgi:hypothetical protein
MSTAFYNTGKVRIGIAHTPKPPPSDTHMDQISRALLPDSKRLREACRRELHLTLRGTALYMSVYLVILAALAAYAKP